MIGAILNFIIKQKAEGIKQKIVGIELPEKGRIGSLNQAALSPDKRKPADISSKSLKRFLETQEREMNMSSVQKAQRYFSNYTTALRSVFGGFSEYDEHIEFIENKIIHLAKKDFEVLQTAIDGSPDIKFIYDPIARDAKLKRLLEYWRAV